MCIYIYIYATFSIRYLGYLSDVPNTELTFAEQLRSVNGKVCVCVCVRVCAYLCFKTVFLNELMVAIGVLVSEVFM